MLVIGHRGAAGLAPENTLKSMGRGMDAGADMLEIDVRVTSDNVPILAHDPKIKNHRISHTPLKTLEKAGHVTTLSSALDKFFGKIYLNLHLKPGDIDAVYSLIKKDYIKKPNDWNNLLFSSFHVTHLVRLRRRSRHVNLALLHSINPLSFLAYHPSLRLSAVGWHRLHYNKIAVQIARKLKIFTYVYTVNRPETAKIFARRGVDGIVTDYPDRVNAKLNNRK